MRMFLTAVIVVVALAGCGNTQDRGAADDHQVRTQQTNPSKKDNKSPQEVAERLARLANSVPQVNSANCVVFGNVAIVGIDVKGDLERSRVGTIKYSVAESLRKDPYGKNAIVTADIDMNNRIREIAADIRNGRPVAGFANELADIIGRIMPQLPRDTAPPAKQQEPTRTEDSKQLNRKNL